MKLNLDEILISEADAFAERAHFGHTRSNQAKEPYINHLREVANLVKISGGDTEEVCAGLLHDSVEDTSVTLNEILENFGPEIYKIVEALTDKPESNKLPTLERKTLQAKHVKRENTKIKRVKLSDQISNVICVTVDPPLKWERQKCIDYIEGARRIAFECSGVSEYLDKKFNEVHRKALVKYNL
jgi:(p)ppGpp synthase/HD superfamily hydrolase